MPPEAGAIGPLLAIAALHQEYNGFPYSQKAYTTAILGTWLHFAAPQNLSAIGIAADIVWFVGPRVGPINHHRRRLMSFCIRRTVMRAFVGVSRFAWTRGLKKIILTPTPTTRTTAIATI
jgi:hypothetical protein